MLFVGVLGRVETKIGHGLLSHTASRGRDWEVRGTAAPSALHIGTAANPIPRDSLHSYKHIAVINELNAIEYKQNTYKQDTQNTYHILTNTYRI